MATETPAMPASTESPINETVPLTPDAPASEPPKSEEKPAETQKVEGTTGFSMADLGLSGPTQAAVEGDDGITEMGLDDESVRAYDFDLYEVTVKGQTDRISIIDPTKIFSARIHFKQGMGYFVCQSKWERRGDMEICTEQAPCCEHLEPPRKRFAAMIVQYSTTPEGRFVEPIGYKCKLWKFTEDKYVMLRNINREFPLKEHDVMITCTEPKYKKMTIAPARGCAWRLPKFPSQPIHTWVKQNEGKMRKQVAKKLSRQELLEKLGLAVQSTSIVQTEIPMTELGDLLR